MKILSTIFLINFLLLGFTQIAIYAQTQGEVGVTASVSGCTARILIKPEKRLPREGNFSNKNLVVFYNQFYQEIYRFENIETDNDGYADIDLCSKGIVTVPGIYSIYVKGYSHISKLFTEEKGFFNYTTFFNLAEDSNDYLIAGDTTNHDYVNGLDLTESLSKLYSDNIKSDLNRDGIVNGLDLSNLIYNLHKTGELKL